MSFMNRMLFNVRVQIDGFVAALFNMTMNFSEEGSDRITSSNMMPCMGNPRQAAFFHH